MNYTDFTIRARDWQDRQFKVEVTGSPVDRMRESEVVTYDEAALGRSLRNLEHKRIRLRDLITLGEALADLLLPPTVREMFVRSLEAVGPQQGLRLRLVLDDPQVANLPWEYVYLHRTGGEKGRDGFVVLDPRISLTRHEAIPIAPSPVRVTRPLKVVVGLSSPSDAVELDLEAERGGIEEALSDEDGGEGTFVEGLTMEKLEADCQGAHVFHFAGHGSFEVEGDNVVLLEDSHGRSHPFPAENLALTLRGAGVRLVVLGACETGRRDGVNIWSGVAPSLMRANIPAAVAMQYEIYDDSAIAFTRRFYQALAAGISLDEAVTAGRLAVLNVGTVDDVDWGVPVLYMRSPDGVIFPEVTHDPVLDGDREELRVEVQQRVTDLRGQLVGAEVDEMTGGEVAVEQTITTVADGGEATGFKARKLGGGEVETDQKANTVDAGGTVTGVKLGTVGGRTARAQSGLTASDLLCPNCHSLVKAGWQFCPNCCARLSVGL